jgi:prophage regulatory protein
MVGLSRATLYRLERNDQFPKRIKLGANATAFLLSDIRSWMEGRIEAST